MVFLITLPRHPEFNSRMLRLPLFAKTSINDNFRLTEYGPLASPVPHRELSLGLVVRYFFFVAFLLYSREVQV